MGITASKVDLQKLDKVAEILKAIGHPVRIQIIDLLGQYKRLSVTEIQEYLNVEQSLASHHLTKMKDKGVLFGEREGKNMFYELADEKITGIIDCIQNCDV